MFTKSHNLLGYTTKSDYEQNAEKFIGFEDVKFHEKQNVEDENYNLLMSAVNGVELVYHNENAETVVDVEAEED